MARLSNGAVGNTSCTLRRIGDVSADGHADRRRAAG